jgi:hypothetical protein
LSIGSEGFYVGVTPSAQVPREEISAEAAKFAENRAVIEQAKGMLMNVYGIGADAAFELLKWRSQETNVKLRPVAEQIDRDFVALTRDHETPARTEYDNLLLTAHERITDDTPTDTPTVGSTSDAAPSRVKRPYVTAVPDRCWLLNARGCLQISPCEDADATNPSPHHHRYCRPSRYVNTAGRQLTL